MDGYYNVLVIQPKLRPSNRENLERSLNLIDGYVLYAGLEVPVRLVVFPEFWLQAARGAHVKEERKEPRQIQVPGEETDRLGEKAAKHNLYIVGTAETIEPEWPDRTWNVAFIIGPNGKVIHKYYKFMTTNNAMECNLSPHDVYDLFTEKFGDSLDAFFPVADTEIGKLGVFTCYDGNFPEIPRALAVNGAEVLIRPAAWPDPCQDEPLDIWTLENRMRAFENNCYLIAANQGGGGYMETDINAGHSMIVDYKGRILAQSKKTGDTLIYNTINVDELRKFRQTAKAFNFLPALRTEVFQKIYEKPIWPKDLWLEKPPGNIFELEEAFNLAKDRLRARKVFPKD